MVTFDSPTRLDYALFKFFLLLIMVVIFLGIAECNDVYASIFVLLCLAGLLSHLYLKDKCALCRKPVGSYKDFVYFETYKCAPRLICKECLRANKKRILLKKGGKKC